MTETGVAWKVAEKGHSATRWAGPRGSPARLSRVHGRRPKWDCGAQALRIAAERLLMHNPLGSTRHARQRSEED